MDVFFVISGYLITGHLLREVYRTGGIDLPAFYARRACRLLPAASLTLFGVALASYLWMPPMTWQNTAIDILASTLYAQNWVLVQRSVDYLALDALPSPLQHFWSLSVEEQFYFLWPLVVAGATACWKLHIRKHRTGTGAKDDMVSFSAVNAVLAPQASPWVYITPMGAICLLSFATAVLYAQTNPASGYFMTHVRMFELGLGGMLSVWTMPKGAHLLCPGLPSCYKTRTVGAALGLAGIIATVFLYTPRLPFPGFAALVPVLCTALVIASGGPEDHAHGLTPLFSHPWLQYIGAISYSLYLAHWPVVVMYPFATGKDADSSLADGAFVIFVSVSLAHACKMCWEDRFRLVDTPRQSQGQTGHIGLVGPEQVAQDEESNETPLGCARALTQYESDTAFAGVRNAATMALLMACATILSSLILFKCTAYSHQVDGMLQNLAQGHKFDKKVTLRNLSPMEAQKCPVFQELGSHPGADILFYGCSPLNSLPASEAVPPLSAPEFARNGEPFLFWNPPNSSTPKGHIVLMGDSQARLSWSPAFGAVARRMGFKFTNLGKNNCPPTLTTVRRHNSAVVNHPCRNWTQNCMERVLSEKPSVVVLVAADRYYSADAKSKSNANAVAAGVVQVVKPFVAAGIPVLGIKATPQPDKNVAACLMQELKRTEPNNNACAFTAKVGMKQSCVEAAARLYPVMRMMSFDDMFCLNSTCPPRIGDVIVYRDGLHLTTTFSESLANALQRELLRAAPHLASLAEN